MEGIIQETTGNLGHAEELFAKSLDMNTLPMNKYLLCLGNLIELEFRKILVNPFETIKKEFLEKIDQWETLSKEHHQVESLCKLHLFKASLELSQQKLDSAKSILDQCIQLADKFNLKLYKNIAEFRKAKITKQIDKLEGKIHPEDVIEYMKDAMSVIDELKYQKK